jgi:hypothetical protein
MVPRGSTLRERLELLADKSGGPEACWPWGGTIGEGGYGFMMVHTEQRPAHVWALIAEGHDMTGLFGLHECDNPPCVNPAHLKPGTNAQNMADKVKRGRQSRLPGEVNPQAKLTAEQVLELRRLHRGGMRATALALKFGIHRNNVYLIVQRKRWAHLPEEATP